MKSWTVLIGETDVYTLFMQVAHDSLDQLCHFLRTRTVFGDEATLGHLILAELRFGVSPEFRWDLCPYSLLESFTRTACQCKNSTCFQDLPPLHEVLSIAPRVTRNGGQGLVADSQNSVDVVLGAMREPLLLPIPVYLAIADDGPGNSKVMD